MLEYTSRIQGGNICMVLCCLTYLVWWAIAFHPMKAFPKTPKFLLFFVTLILGMTGLYLLISGIIGIPIEKKGISNLTIAILGCISYGCMLFFTSHFLHRQVTSELLLIMIWTVLELWLWNSLYRGEVLGITLSLVYAVVIVFAAMISLACYLQYYKLEPIKAFYDGMIPLVLFGAVMIVQTIIIRANVT